MREYVVHPDLFPFDFAPPGGFVCANASDAKNGLTTAAANISDKASRTIFILKTSIKEGKKEFMPNKLNVNARGMRSNAVVNRR